MTMLCSGAAHGQVIRKRTLYLAEAGRQLGARLNEVIRRVNYFHPNEPDREFRVVDKNNPFEIPDNDKIVAHNSARTDYEQVCSGCTMELECRPHPFEPLRVNVHPEGAIGTFPEITSQRRPEEWFLPGE